jgi:hypothetical protein
MFKVHTIIASILFLAFVPQFANAGQVKIDKKSAQLFSCLSAFNKKIAGYKKYDKKSELENLLKHLEAYQKIKSENRLGYKYIDEPLKNSNRIKRHIITDKGMFYCTIEKSISESFKVRVAKLERGEDLTAKGTSAPESRVTCNKSEKSSDIWEKQTAELFKIIGPTYNIEQDLRKKAKLNEQTFNEFANNFLLHECSEGEALAEGKSYVGREKYAREVKSINREHYGELNDKKLIEEDKKISPKQPKFIKNAKKNVQVRLRAAQHLNNVNQRSNSLNLEKAGALE